MMQSNLIHNNTSALWKRHKQGGTQLNTSLKDKYERRIHLGAREL